MSRRRTSRRMRGMSTAKGDSIHVGAIPQHQQAALQSVAPSADDIFSNMNELSQEVLESHPELVGVPEGEDGVRQVDLVDMQLPPEPDDFIAAEEAAMDAKLAQMREAAEQEKAAQLAVAAEEAAREALDEPVDIEEELSMHDKIVALLKDSADAPSELQINRWKAAYKDNVFCLALGEGDVYIFTPLTRGNWRKIQETITGMRGTAAMPSEEALEEKMKETVVQYSVKWPNIQDPTFFYTSKAGVIETLYSTIMLQSYFLSPAQAMVLTTKL